MADPKPQLTAGEWTILQVVWEHGPCAAPTVQEELEDEKGWAYTTVKTMMERMEAKGLLEVERIRNLMLYRSVITRPQAQKREVMSAVKRAFDGAMTPMMQFLVESNELNQKQLSELEELIKQKRRRSASSKKRKS